MKNKLVFMIFTVVLLLNISCTSDDYDNQEINEIQKEIKVINLKSIDSQGTGIDLLKTEQDGDPSNPKIKE